MQTTLTLWHTTPPAVIALAMALAALSGAPVSAQLCQPTWSDEFPRVDLRHTTVMRVLDDGTGSALYIGGDFHYPSPGGASVVRRRVGGTAAGWEFLGPGPLARRHGGPQNRAVSDLVMFDDGGGTSLFAVTNGPGSFPVGPWQGALSKWTGETWEEIVLQGGSSPHVFSSAIVFDDGSGAALYLGGSFTQLGGEPIGTLASWRGQPGPGGWEQVGAFMPAAFAAAPSIRAMHIFDDGRGPALYVGGHFSSVNGLAAPSVARFDGATWESLRGGGGGVGVDGIVSAMTSAVLPSGPVLYVGGWLQSAGGAPVNGVAGWDGQEWHALGAGRSDVRSMAGSSAGGASRLYIASGSQVHEWDGTAWTTIGTNVNNFIDAIASFDPGTGEELWFGGIFSKVGGVNGPFAPGFAWWDGHEFQTEHIGFNVHAGTEPSISSLAGVEFQGQRLLMVGGFFDQVGDVEASRSAIWNAASSAWSAVPGTHRSPLSSAIVFDDGSGFGPAVYASFGCLMVPECITVARWNGIAWETLAQQSEMHHPGKLVVFDDGSGPALYVVRARGTILARWNGAGWIDIPGAPDEYSGVWDAAVFDDGSGTALYVAGSFEEVAGVPIRGIARFDGTSWSDVGGSLDDGVGYTLRVIGGDGVAAGLYLGGQFSHVGGAPAGSIARWDGAWSSLPPFPTSSVARIHAIEAFDDGGGRAIFAGGAGLGAAFPYASLARLEGQSWTMISAEKNVYVLSAWDDGRGDSLWIGGTLGQIEGVPFGVLSRYIGCAAKSCYANCDVSTVEPVLNVDDFTCFINEFSEAMGLPPEQQIVHYANCDGSMRPPVLNVEDFMCFLNAFAAGCP